MQYDLRFEVLKFQYDLGHLKNEWNSTEQHKPDNEEAVIAKIDYHIFPNKFPLCIVRFNCKSTEESRNANSWILVQEIWRHQDPADPGESSFDAIGHSCGELQKYIIQHVFHNVLSSVDMPNYRIWIGQTPRNESFIQAENVI